MKKEKSKTKSIYEKQIMLYFNEMVRYRNLYDYTCKLLSENGREQILSYLRSHEYKRIAVYGSGIAGKIIYDILKNQPNIELVGVIDKNQNKDYGINQFISIEYLKKIETDCVIVTPLSACEEIFRDLHVHGIDNAVFALEMIESEEINKVYGNGVFI